MFGGSGGPSRTIKLTTPRVTEYRAHGISDRALSLLPSVSYLDSEGIVALKFKLLDVPVVIGADFILIMLVLGAFWRTPEQLPVWMVVVTGSVLLHEFGHATFFDFFGFKPVIRLYGAGGVTMAMSAPNHRISPRQHIVIAAAGPATGLILGGMVGLAVLAAPRIASNDVVQDLLWVSLGWSLVNLLPFPGTDGGSIVTETTAIILGRPAETVGRFVGLVIVGAVLVGLLLFGLYDWAFIVGFFAVINAVRLGWRFGGSSGAAGPNAPAQLMLQGKYQDAFNAARLAMADHPDDLAPVLLASDALRLMSKYADSEWGYNRVLAGDPANARAMRGLAFTLRRLGRAADAGACLNRLLALPADVASISQAAALYDADRHEEGHRLVASVLPYSLNPGLTKTLQSFESMFEYALGREVDALRHVDALVAEIPDDPALREQRALILIDLGRFPEAVDDARRALSQKPQHPSYLETLGIAARMGGNASGALQPLSASTAARPGDPRARAELALCQMQLGLMGEARAALETLPGHLQRDPFATYARAAMAANGGSAGDAIALLNEARRMRPELGVRAGVDPLFRNLLADPAARAALAGPTV